MPPADLAVVERLPTATRLSRAIDYADGGSNHGIAALGVNPAASGRWDRVDLLIRIAGTPDADVGDDVTVEVGRRNRSATTAWNDSGTVSR